MVEAVTLELLILERELVLCCVCDLSIVRLITSCAVEVVGSCTSSTSSSSSVATKVANFLHLAQHLAR